MDFGVAYFPTHDGVGPGDLARMRQRVEVMKATWTVPEASYQGAHVAFDRIWSYPKPARRPHKRAVHWLPTGGRSTVERALERWEAAVADLNGE